MSEPQSELETELDSAFEKIAEPKEIEKNRVIFSSVLHSAKELRSKTHSQGSISEKIGCSRQHISLIETGKTVPNAVLFLAYLEALGISVKFEFPRT